jgi:hypothetical protein
MAVKEILIDDIDGETEGAETINFTLDGQEWAIDLAEENYLLFQQKLDEHRAWLKEMADYGRPVERRIGQISKPKPTRSPKELAEIREWLRGQGHKVSDFGRIREELMDLWETRPRGPVTSGGDNGTGEGEPKTAEKVKENA